MNQRHLQKELSLLKGAAKKARFEAYKTENNILYALAKFGWLTSHQVSDLVFQHQRNANDKARKILKRLSDNNCVTFNHLKRSPAGQIRGWYIKPKGMTRLLEIEPYQKALRVHKTSRSFMDSKYCYHRLITNQVVIDMHIKRNSLPFRCDSFIPEHEINIMRNNVKSEFGCIPDALAINNGELILIETENSCRGPKLHGSKLTHWLEVFVERVASQRQFKGHLLQLGHTGAYSDVRQLFVCTSEKNFRSIWRKVEKVMGKEQCRIHRHVFYVVLNKPIWVNPLKSIVTLEHNERRTLELIKAGEARKRKYN